MSNADKLIGTVVSAKAHCRPTAAITDGAVNLSQTNPALAVAIIHMLVSHLSTPSGEFSKSIKFGVRCCFICPNPCRVKTTNVLLNVQYPQASDLALRSGFHAPRVARQILSAPLSIPFQIA
jgi:hypothetical protein